MSLPSASLCNPCGSAVCYAEYTSIFAEVRARTVRRSTDDFPAVYVGHMEAMGDVFEVVFDGIDIAYPTVPPDPIANPHWGHVGTWNPTDGIEVEFFDSLPPRDDSGCDYLMHEGFPCYEGAPFADFKYFQLFLWSRAEQWSVRYEAHPLTGGPVSENHLVCDVVDCFIRRMSIRLDKEYRLRLFRWRQTRTGPFGLPCPVVSEIEPSDWMVRVKRPLEDGSYVESVEQIIGQRLPAGTILECELLPPPLPASPDCEAAAATLSPNPGRFPAVSATAKFVGDRYILAWTEANTDGDFCAPVEGD